MTVTPGRGGPAGDVGVLAAPPSNNTQKKTMIINPNEDSWSIIQGQEVLYISVDWNSLIQVCMYVFGTTFVQQT